MQLIVKNAPVDYRFLEHDAPKLEDAFPVGSEGVYIGNDATLYGSQLLVKKVISQESSVEVEVSKDKRVFPFPSFSSKTERYFPSGQVCF